MKGEDILKIVAIIIVSIGAIWLLVKIGAVVFKIIGITALVLAVLYLIYVINRAIKRRDRY